MMTIGINFMVAQHVLTNTDEYAQNSRHPTNLDVDFKRKPSKTTFKNYSKTATINGESAPRKPISPSARPENQRHTSTSTKTKNTKKRKAPTDDHQQSTTSSHQQGNDTPKRNNRYRLPGALEALVDDAGL